MKKDNFKKIQQEILKKKPKSNKKSHWKQGKFIPKHPEKYLGSIDNITYRSGWELKMMNWLDSGNPNIISWNSESVIIPYIKPTDGKMHRYFVDFYLKYKNKKGQIIQEIIEIKPYAQTRPPRKKSKNQLNENLTYAINCAKWESAARWCRKRGLKFRIVTEKELFR